MKLKHITHKGKKYPVKFVQTPNVSNTDMKKEAIVQHMTTSNSFKGLIGTFTKGRNASTLFGVGREIGEVAQFGTPDQKFWHAGNVYEPSKAFKKIAKKTPRGKYTNPNLYTDGIEYCGGEDKNNDNYISEDEIELTEWQYDCGIQLMQWHAKTCGYELTPEKIIAHCDIASYKPDMVNVVDELEYRMFRKDVDKVDNKLFKLLLKLILIWKKTKK